MIQKAYEEFQYKILPNCNMFGLYLKNEQNSQFCRQANIITNEQLESCFRQPIHFLGSRSSPSSFHPYLSPFSPEVLLRPPPPPWKAVGSKRRGLGSRRGLRAEERGSASQLPGGLM